ncbi:glutamate--tRNA ligase [Sphingorhabdus lutea]|uniref:Glutamate--tRNA ligase n=1 Tax=Sphingorhabdus lutea TaxID=1913578 RepID=A0A1L3JFD7_9SPHN|nr:glutamate--tRNA ligase [Sphingorhabdus lutea]APG63834.1 glutamate--tRNA ligase [Sphingorhabdus lutea]
MTDQNKPIRTRIAPSPTGDPHVGTAYIALINYCFAKKHGGEFILRIEDTDQVRSTPQSEKMILDSLRWLGLDWSEGPDIGGPHGPYRQSERSDIYKEHADILLQKGKAFKCYCTAEKLAEMRKDQIARKKPPRYDGTCLSLTDAERSELDLNGVPHVVRMKIPESGTCVVNDTLRGEIKFEWAGVDMQVIMKSDGLPTYHMANVVDDHLMGITHVLRGEEWISSAPKHLALYDYFGWEAPVLTHLPLLLNADKSKLSKRKNPTSILYYQRAGYLAEAMVNFLGLFIKSSTEEDEKVTLQHLIDDFDVDHISLGGSVFDTSKLDWLNGRYLREDMDGAGFLEQWRKWALNDEYMLPIAQMTQSRIVKLSDLGALTAMFFMNRIDGQSAEKLRDGVKLDELQQRQAYHLALTQFDAMIMWNKEGVDGALRTTAAALDVKLKDMIRAFYIAVTGSAQGVPLFDGITHLGRDIIRERLRHALELLGTPTAKEGKAWADLLVETD